MTCLIAPYSKDYAFCMLSNNENFQKSLQEIRDFIERGFVFKIPEQCFENKNWVEPKMKQK